MNHSAQAPVVRRSVNLDLIRCTAVFCVVFVHFFLNSGFYEREVAGKPMVVLCAARTLAMVCVPLFALLTGYLNSRKPLSRAYFAKLGPVLLTYLLCAALNLGHRVLREGEQISLINALMMILQISDGAVFYGWYIEMYIGLFLLAPFLNVLYQGLETRSRKRMLLAVLGILTVLPNSVNLYSVVNVGALPALAQITWRYELLPGWWTDLWPLTYYFLGAYFREYGVEASAKKLFWLLAGALCLSAGYNVFRSYGYKTFEPFEANWGGLQCTVNAALLFLWLLRLDLSRLPGWCQRLLGRLSRLSLAIYLCSRISDLEVYRVFNGMHLSVSRQLLAMPLAIGASFCLAAALAQGVTWVQEGLVRLGNRKN